MILSKFALLLSCMSSLEMAQQKPDPYSGLAILHPTVG